MFNELENRNLVMTNKAQTQIGIKNFKVSLNAAVHYGTLWVRTYILTF